MSELNHRRSGVSGKRELRLTLDENAHKAVGALYSGCEIYGFSKGQFSLIDLVVACLDQTGPADVTISTWTAARREVDSAERLLMSGAIRSLRWLVDYSFPRRQPEYCARLRDKFGDDTIRVTSTHAKFILIRNERWNLAIRTSMNLNKNPRFENFEISDDAGMADFLERVVHEVFEASDDAASFGENPQFHKNLFGVYGIEPKAWDELAAKKLGASYDDPFKPGLSIGG